MPLALSDAIVPGGAFPSHEDVYGKGGFMVVADLTERDAIPALRRKAGMHVYVVAAGATFKLVGGITNGDWVEQTAPNYGRVITDADWYIDPVGGSDANDGLSALTALASWAGLKAVFGDRPLIDVEPEMVIHILGSLDPADIIDVDGWVIRHRVIVTGSSAVTTARTGSLSNVTAFDAATNQAWEVQEIGEPPVVFANEVGKRCTITSNNARQGYGWWIAKGVEDVARISTPCLPDLTTPWTTAASETPQIGDQYVVEDLPSAALGLVQNVSVQLAGANDSLNGLWFRDLDLSAGDTPNGATQINAVSAYLVFQRCKLGDYLANETPALEFQDCYSGNGYLTTTFSVLHAGRGGGAACNAGAWVTGVFEHLIQGTATGYEYNAIYDAGVIQGSFAIFDLNLSLAAPYSGIDFYGGAAYLGDLSGNVGSGKYGVYVDKGSRAFVVFTDAATVAITGAEGDIGCPVGDASAWNAARNTFTAPRVMSWAQFDATVEAGGFSKVMCWPATGSTVMRYTPGAGFIGKPTDPYVGEEVYDADAGHVVFWNGTDWQHLQDGGVSHTFASDLNYALSTAQFAFNFIEFITGSWTQGRTVTIPAPLTAAGGYFRTFANSTSYALTLSAGGITLVLSPGEVARVFVDQSGPRRIGAVQSGLVSIAFGAPASTPTTGLIRLTYDGAPSRAVITTLSNVGANRNVLTVGSGVTQLGNVNEQTWLDGSRTILYVDGSTYIDCYSGTIGLYYPIYYYSAQADWQGNAKTTSWSKQVNFLSTGTGQEVAYTSPALTGPASYKVVVSISATNADATKTASWDIVTNIAVSAGGVLTFGSPALADATPDSSVHAEAATWKAIITAGAGGDSSKFVVKTTMTTTGANVQIGMIVQVQKTVP